jgi:Zn-dependent protease
MFDLLSILPALILAITIHEFSHAFAADRLGDPTARLAGRLTLNPLKHLDPIGTLALIIFRFGWGKPVPVDYYNLKNPVRDSAIISLAGPASNIISAILASLIFNYLAIPALQPFLIFFITISVMLAIFNLLPLHPLDGSHILAALLPKDLAREYNNFSRRYGFIILLALIFPIFGTTPPIQALLIPPINFFLNFLL